MAMAHGKNAALKVNNGSLRNLSTFISKVSGPPGEREMTDTTTMKGSSGAHYRSFLPGLNTWKIEFSGGYDSTATTGPDAILSALLVDETVRAWDVGYEGDTAGLVKYSGSGYVASYTPDAAVDGWVTFTGTVQGTGAFTRGYLVMSSALADLLAYGDVAVKLSKGRSVRVRGLIRGELVHIAQLDGDDMAAHTIMYGLTEPAVDILEACAMVAVLPAGDTQRIEKAIMTESGLTDEATAEDEKSFGQPT